MSTPRIIIGGAIGTLIAVALSPLVDLPDVGAVVFGMVFALVGIVAANWNAP